MCSYQSSLSPEWLTLPHPLTCNCISCSQINEERCFVALKYYINIMNLICFMCRKFKYIIEQWFVCIKCYVEKRLLNVWVHDVQAGGFFHTIWRYDNSTTLKDMWGFIHTNNLSTVQSSLFQPICVDVSSTCIVWKIPLILQLLVSNYI